MKIDLYDVDEFVSINKLKPVTSAVLFQRGGVPHPEGLVSNEIFGITVKSRKETMAYIDLYTPFFHPHMYKVVQRMFRNIDKIINGEEFYRINNEGILVVDRENGETGLQFLYDNWSKIKWKKVNDSNPSPKSVIGMRSERAGLIEKCKRDEVFITKMPVLPVYYRDIRSTARGGETNDLNGLYRKLILQTTLLRDRSMFGFEFHATNYNIQQCIVAIYDYFKQKLEKKNGMIRKFLMGKTIDYSVRTVITAPTYHANHPSDMMVDFYHAAVPISQVCALAYPYMMHWLKNFFDREVIAPGLEKIVYNPENDTIEKTVKLKDPAQYFDEKYIKRIMDMYIQDPSSRFNPIEIPVEGTSKKMYLSLTGKRMGNGKEGLASTMYRRMTITDLLYMAAVDVTKDKHAKVTRYPITDEFSIFITKIRINSTTKTEPVMINDQLYKWYPVIEPDTPYYKIGALFVDSVQFSNSYLKGILGDYDGDQCTVHILFSQEANMEVDEYTHRVSNFINSGGKMIRQVESEAIQTFYTLTKDYDDSKPITAEKRQYLLETEPSAYTFDDLVRMFSIRQNKVTGEMIEPEYRPGDKMNVPKGFWGNASDIQTTVGRFILYQIIFVQSKLTDIVPFENKVSNNTNYGSYESRIARALTNGSLSVEKMSKYIDIRDWFGLQLHAPICTSFTPGILFLPKSIQQLKQKLVKDNEEKLSAGDPKAGEAIEQELIKNAREALKGDPGLDLYDSGARGSFNNNYKNINLIRGPVFNEATKKFDFIANSLMDGLSKTDFTPHANSLVNGAYPKSIGTAESGYLGKQLQAMLQMERLNPDPESDCGTKYSLTITLSKDIIHDYDYRYIIENGKLKLLDPSIIEQYAGKTVKMRSVMFCNGGNVKCAKCAGLYYYKLKKEFIGLQTVRASTTLTNANMKKFHDNTIHTQIIDPSKLLM